MRLGWFSGWVDSWYSGGVYYAELLHDIFRIRLYLGYFFLQPFLEAAGFYLSHFELLYKKALLQVRIFYYDASLTGGIHAFCGDFYNRYLRRTYRRLLRKRRRFSTFLWPRYARVFLLLFHVFFNFSFFFRDSYFLLALDKPRGLQSSLSHSSIRYPYEPYYLDWYLFKEGSGGLGAYVARYNRVRSKGGLVGPWGWHLVRYFMARLKRCWRRGGKVHKVLLALIRRLRGPCFPVSQRRRGKPFGAATSAFYRRALAPRAPRSFKDVVEGADTVVRLRELFPAYDEIFDMKRFSKVQHFFKGRRKGRGRRSFLFRLFVPRLERVGLFRSWRFGDFKIRRQLPRPWHIMRRAILRFRWFGRGRRPLPLAQRLAIVKRSWGVDLPRLGVSLFTHRCKIRKFRRRYLLQRLLRITLRFCSPGKFLRHGRLVRGLLVRLGRKGSLGAEIKLLFLFLVLFNRLWLAFHSPWQRQRISSFSYLHDFFFMISSLFFYQGSFFRLFSRALHFIIALLVPSFASEASFFVISNDSVTASFLSSFVGRRLVLGHRVRSILHPIMQDLARVARLNRTPRRNFVARQLSSSMGYRSGLLRSFAKRSLLLFRRLFAKSFYLHHSWINFYLLYVFKGLLVYCWGGPCLFGAARSFLSRKGAFLFFFNFDYAALDDGLPFIFNSLFRDVSFPLPLVESLFFFVLFEDLFSGFSSILFAASWSRWRLDHSFAAVVYFCNRLLRLGYWKFSHRWLFSCNHLNKRFLRLFRDLSPFALRGFKFHLRGRFSRKQRASSIWYTRGKVPLNTLAAWMDYSFAAYPLRNSLVSIKVWLYKGPSYPRWFLRQL